MHKFINRSVLHLPQINSDHRPVLVRFDKAEKQHRGNMSFRFLAASLTHQYFDNFVAVNREHNVSYLQVVKDFTTNMSHWNHNIFGNIFQRKRRLLVRIGGIQKTMETWATRGLCCLVLKLKIDLEEVLTQEELP